MTTQRTFGHGHLKVWIGAPGDCPPPWRPEVATLDALLLAMQGNADANWSDLPTFGGPDVTSPCCGVWSWDAERMIIGTSASDIKIVARSYELTPSESYFFPFGLTGRRTRPL